MKLDSLRTLWIEEMKDLYNAENQLLKALPKMAKRATTPELKKAFESHLEETQTHVERLDEIFVKLGKKPNGKTCKAMKGLIEEGSEMMKEDGLDSVIDAGIIAQREHFIEQFFLGDRAAGARDQRFQHRMFARRQRQRIA